jgi:hypothetical protein
MIEPSKTENQFYIAMAASDETGDQADSILLFQFSRTQNLIFHWKFRVPVVAIHSMADSGILIVVNKY